jgi:hypothetical protein
MASDDEKAGDAVAHRLRATKLPRHREVRNLAWSTLTTANGRLAEVLTYATRTLSDRAWTYRTVVIGLKGDEGRAWFGTWETREAAERGHADTCRKLSGDQGVTLQ